MPWRNFINKRLETHTTTDMSDEHKAEMEAQGWRESNLMAFHLLTCLQGRDPRRALATLKALIEWSESDDDDPNLAGIG